MKRLPVILLAIAAVACSETAMKQSPMHDKAVEAGRRDAQKVIDAAAASMEQERAVLEIQIKAERLRQAGDTLTANAYHEAAWQMLDSAAVL